MRTNLCRLRGMLFWSQYTLIFLSFPIFNCLLLWQSDEKVPYDNQQMSIERHDSLASLYSYFAIFSQSYLHFYYGSQMKKVPYKNQLNSIKRYDGIASIYTYLAVFSQLYLPSLFWHSDE